MKKYAYFLLIFMVALFAAIGSEFKESGTVAKYLSSIDGSDSARVAKWDINAVDEKGESIIMVTESRNVPNGEGSWYFQISNNSEVNAKISETSKIKIRLDSDQLSEIYKVGEHYWDFITVSKNGATTIIDNPINFKLELYSGEITYKVNTAFTFNEVNYAVNSIITVSTYNNILDKNSALLENLTPIYPSSTPVVVFDTNINENDDIKLIYGEEGDDLNKIRYLEATVDVDALELDMTDTYTYKLSWNVSTEGSGNGEGSVSNAYFVYSSYTSASNNVKTTYDYFEYLIYLSSLNGEPSFTYGDKLYRYSKLTEEQINIIKNISTNAGHTYNIVEHQNLLEYERFLENKKNFEANLGYLEMGLKVSIHFELNVEQVD